MSQNESTTQNSSVENLLTGISVIELGDEISAAYCTKMMAYLGAEVLKIEKPSIGDSARSVGPFPDDVADIEKSANLEHHQNSPQNNQSISQVITRYMA